MQSSTEYTLTNQNLNFFKQAVFDKSLLKILHRWQYLPSLRRWYAGLPCLIVDDFTKEGNWITIMGQELIATFRSLLSIGDSAIAIIDYIYSGNQIIKNWYSNLSIPYLINQEGKIVYRTISFIELFSDFKLALNSRHFNLVNHLWSSSVDLKNWCAGYELITNQSEYLPSKITLDDAITCFELSSTTVCREIADILLWGIIQTYSENIKQNISHQYSLIRFVFDNYLPSNNAIILSFLELITHREVLDQAKNSIRFGLVYKTSYRAQKLSAIESRLMALDSQPTIQPIEPTLQPSMSNQNYFSMNKQEEVDNVNHSAFFSPARTPAPQVMASRVLGSSQPQEADDIDKLDILNYLSNEDLEYIRSQFSG